MPRQPDIEAPSGESVALPWPRIAETVADKLKLADAFPADIAIAIAIAAARTSDPAGIQRSDRSTSWFDGCAMSGTGHTSSPTLRGDTVLAGVLVAPVPDHVQRIWRTWPPVPQDRSAVQTSPPRR